MLALVILILEHDFEHLGEVLAEMVRRGALDASATDGDVKLHSSSVLCASEALICGLTTSDDRAGQELFVDLCIDLLNLVLEHSSILLRCVCCMPLLPEELTSANEWRWVLKLPSDDIGPLVE